MAQARTQSNAMLYALITFVALFVVGVVCAVIFYVKSEEYRTQFENTKADTQKVVSMSEQSNLGKIVGDPKGKTYMTLLNEHFNKLYSIITGVLPAEELSADTKLNDITVQITKLLASLEQDVDTTIGPDNISLLKTVTDMKSKLDDARRQLAEKEALYQKVQDEFTAAKKENEFKEQQLVEQVKTYQQNADAIQAKYDELKNQMTASAEEQIQAVNTRLTEEQGKLKQKQMELTDAQTKLSEASKSLNDALSKLESIKPKPDREVAAYQRDVNILRVDLQNEMVYLDGGSENHIYRGLTFAVFDRNMPIPESGEGKAEIEVFQVEPKVSVARIVKGSKKNPVVKEDLVANMIWDSKASNKFVVLGAFDFDNNGKNDADGNKRICEMIEHWGGIVEQDVTIDTDFVVVGQTPTPLPKPEQEAVDADPSVLDKYNASLEAAAVYNGKLKRAQELAIPVFSQKRFLYLIGYDSSVNTTLTK